MKKILLYVGIALAAIGCAKDPDVAQSGDSVLTIASNINTRVENEQWEVSDKIGVYMTSSTFGDLGANVLYTTVDGNGAFTASATPLYYPSSGEVDIFAYYPWVDGVSLTAYPIDSEAQVDLLWATKSEVASSSAAVVMSFNHLLSKVSLTIKEGDGLEKSDLAGLVVTLTDITTTADFNLEDPTASSLTNSDGELTLTTAEDGTSSSVIVIPQPLGGATLYFATKDYGTFSATLSTSEFEVGKEYKYTATLNL
ncbi:MAG: fimbrillin family protein [Rikenellaceae bacterium]